MDPFRIEIRDISMSSVYIRSWTEQPPPITSYKYRDDFVILRDVTTRRWQDFIQGDAWFTKGKRNVANARLFVQWKHSVSMCMAECGHISPIYDLGRYKLKDGEMTDLFPVSTPPLMWRSFKEELKFDYLEKVKLAGDMADKYLGVERPDVKLIYEFIPG